MTQIQQLTEVLNKLDPARCIYDVEAQSNEYISEATAIVELVTSGETDVTDAAIGVFSEYLPFVTLTPDDINSIAQVF